LIPPLPAKPKKALKTHQAEKRKLQY
jgi:hypothetical protein